MQKQVEASEEYNKLQFRAQAEKLELIEIGRDLQDRLDAAGGVMDVQGIANLANTNLDSKAIVELRKQLSEIKKEKETVEKAAREAKNKADKKPKKKK